MAVGCRLRQLGSPAGDWVVRGKQTEDARGGSVGGLASNGEWRQNMNVISHYLFWLLSCLITLLRLEFV